MTTLHPEQDAAAKIGSETSRRINVRMNEIDLRFLDRWIARQPGAKPSRPAAILQLVAEALARK